MIKKFVRFFPSPIKSRIKYFSDLYEIALWKKNKMPSPPPHAIKQKIINHYRTKLKHNILIETGTHYGATIDSQRKNFEQIYSIELSEKYYTLAVNKFKPYKNITIIHGDSGKELYLLVPTLTKSAIFWLDGHYSSGDTAKGDIDCPILEELNAILNNSEYNHSILIDDARLFNGTNDYPEINYLKEFVAALNSNYIMEIKHDIIRFTYKTQLQ